MFSLSRHVKVKVAPIWLAHAYFLAILSKRLSILYDSYQAGKRNLSWRRSCEQRWLEAAGGPKIGWKSMHFEEQSPF